MDSSHQKTQNLQPGNDPICPECETKNYLLFPGYNSINKKNPGTKANPNFCQTCLKLRFEKLERIFEG